MKVFCLSHSDREFELAGTSINGLNVRTALRRPRLTREAVAAFPDVSHAISFSGGLSLWKLDEGAMRLDLLTTYRPDYKVQSAVFAGDHLLVCGSDRLEVLDMELKTVREVRHPLLAGTHTIALDGDGGAWVSSAPANAALRFSLKSWDLTRTVPMPSRYGRGPDLDSGLDLRRNFIPTDYQPTHVNSVIPVGNGQLLVTLWKQGAVVLIDLSNGLSREIITGFIGCHGGRPDGDGYYFTDSSGGHLTRLDGSGRIMRRVSLSSRWVHDILMLDNGTAIAAVADRNAVEIFDTETGVTLFRRSCAPFGKTVMLLSLSEVSADWSRRLGQQSNVTEENRTRRLDLNRPEFGNDEMLPSLHNLHGWMPQLDIVEGFPLRLISRRHLTTEYLLLSKPVMLWSGRYCIRCQVEAAVGSIAIGLLNVDTDTWLFSKPMADHLNEVETVLEVDDPVKARFIVSVHNADSPGPVEANLYWASIRHLY